MIDINMLFATFFGTSLGAYLAFYLNVQKERKSELNKEKAMLYEALDIIKFQASYLGQIKSIFYKNYENNKILILTKDSIDIRSDVKECYLDWLRYGDLIELFSVQEINLEKIIFLVNKRSNGGYSLLRKIRATDFGYQEIKNLIQKRENFSNELDVFYSEHSRQNIVHNVTNKNKLYDLLILGHTATTKLMESIEKCKDEFNYCVNSIEEYIKNEYTEECYAML